MMQKLGYDKLTIYEVESLQKELLPLIQAQSEDLILDMSSIEKIDMAAIQLLLSAQKSCKEKGFKLVLSGKNSVVDEELQLCGCGTLLGGES